MRKLLFSTDFYNLLSVFFPVRVGIVHGSRSFEIFLSRFYFAVVALLSLGNAFGFFDEFPVFESAIRFEIVDDGCCRGIGNGECFLNKRTCCLDHVCEPCFFCFATD